MSATPSSRHSPSTKHGRFREAIAEQIKSGSLSGGDFLPSEPSLAKQFDISRGTVRQALAELQNDGLVERIPGKGTLVLIDTAQQNPAATPEQALRVFAVVLPDLYTGHYPAFMQSFDEASSEFHHQTIFCSTGNDIRRQGDIVLQLIDKKVAGVALLPPTVGAPPVHQIRQLQQNNIPVVLLHRGVEGISAPIIAIPYEKIAQTAAEEMLKCGHRRLAFIASHYSESVVRYYESFADTIRSNGGIIQPEWVKYGQVPIDEKGGRATERVAEVEAAVKELMSLPADRRPTAAFDPWAADAEAIYLALAHLGKQVPKDFSLVSFGGTRSSGALSERITSVVLNEQSFAKTAVGLLEAMCNGREPINSNRQYEVGIELFRRETLAEAP